MVEYITLTKLKSYLNLSDISDYDSKLNSIVDGVNASVSDYINDTPSDPRIVLACLRLCEYYWVKTAGAQSESEGSGGAYKIQFETTKGWPTDVLVILDDYSEGSDDIGETTLELI